MTAASTEERQPLVWLPASATAWEIVIDHRRLRVEELGNATYRCTVAAQNAPAGHILAFQLHETRRAGMDWCAAHAGRPGSNMHLIGEAKP